MNLTSGIAPDRQASGGIDLGDGIQFDSLQENKDNFLLGRNGGYIRVSSSAWQLLQAIRSGITFEELAEALNERPSRNKISKEELEQAYRDVLAKLSKASQKAPGKGLPWGFWLRFRLIPQFVVSRIASWLTFLYEPRIAACLVTILAAALIYMYRGHIPTRVNHADILPAYLLFLASLVFHEFGHASACKRYGAAPSEIGITLYLIYPAFYADVSSAWQLSRWKRVVVDLGGSYFQLLAGCCFLLTFFFTGWEPSRLAFLMIVFTSIFSLNPIFRFDGYWVLADLLDVPNLSRQPARIVGYFVNRLMGRRTQTLPWPGWLLALLTVYSTASVFVWGSFVWRLIPSLRARVLDTAGLVKSLAGRMMSGVLPSWGDVLNVFLAVFMLTIFVVTLVQLAKRLLTWIARQLVSVWKKGQIMDSANQQQQVDTSAKRRLVPYLIVPLLFPILLLSVRGKAVAQDLDSANLREKAAQFMREKYGIRGDKRLSLGPLGQSKNPTYYEAVATWEDPKETKTETISVSKDGRFLVESEMYPLGVDTVPDIMSTVRRVNKLSSDAPVTVDPFRSSMTPGFQMTVISFDQNGEKYGRGYFVTEDRRYLALGEVFTMRSREEVARLLHTGGGQPATGPADAPVTIVEFADFECPTCARMHELVIDKLPAKYGQRVRVVYKDFPLPYHAWAGTAAVAGRCVFQIAPAAFAGYRTAIFSHRKQINPDNLRDRLLAYGEEAGVDRGKLAACVDSKQTLPLVQSDIDEGHQLELAVTPTVFINGRIMAGSWAPEDFYEAIDSALRLPAAGQGRLPVHSEGPGRGCDECSVSPKPRPPQLTPSTPNNQGGPPAGSVAYWEPR